MSTREAVLELATQDMSVVQIAEKLGIFRQRVYQLAPDMFHRRGSRGPRDSKPLGFRAPAARIVTGGIPATISHTVAGKVSELLAAADLMARGWIVYGPIVHNKGHDLIAVSGKSIRTIEVRSARRDKNGTLVFYHNGECRSRHYALVVEGEPVIYRPDIPNVSKSNRFTF